jgi:four helix bundle protein
MSLHVHSLALEAVTELRAVVVRVQRHDRALADQLRRALSSMALNLGEAAYSDPGTKRARLHTAAGSANESRSALAVAVAVAWGYVAERDTAPGLALLDRVVAMLWRLLHPRR